MSRKTNNSRLTAKKIVETLEKNKEKINQYSVKKIGLFGSFLKGKENTKSDIDILVEFENVTFDNYMDLKLYLEKLFKKKIDLVIERNLKPSFSHVKKEAVYA